MILWKYCIGFTANGIVVCFREFLQIPVYHQIASIFVLIYGAADDLAPKSTLQEAVPVLVVFTTCTTDIS